MRKFFTAVAAAVLTLAMTTTAFAGWVEEDGGHRYYKNKNTYLTSQYTEDGYWVDVNGFWDGQPSIGWQGENGERVVYQDILADYPILGERIFKATRAVGDGENRNWTVTVDVYDTAFMTNDEIKNIKKGDQIEMPGIGLTLTAVNKASRGILVTNQNEYSSKKSSTNYKVRLQDSAGNQYILTQDHLRKTSADKTSNATILRPVVSGIDIIVPTWRDSQRINGTSHYTTTKKLVNNGMFFQSELRGNEAQSVVDVIYNYDTTNAPVYDDDAAHGHLYNINEY